jgi:hypothetical protein
MVGNNISDPLLSHAVVRAFTYLRNGNEVAITMIGTAGSRPKRTPQPTSWEPFPRTRKELSAAHSVPALPADQPIVRSLNRRVIMQITDTIGGELGGHILSSIINLVCPQCGGRMSEFQCEGRCRRNWLAEWEYANQATKRKRRT